MGLFAGYDPRRCIPYFVWREDAGMLVPNVVRKSVVFIGKGKGDAFEPAGTGFIVSVTVRGFLFFHIVTAAHVVVGRPDPLYIRMNAVGGGFREYEASFRDWRFHPNPDISTDLAVLPCTPNRDVVEFSHIPIISVATDDVIKEHSIGVGDETFVVGLFRHHKGRGKNLPIVRTGNIALMNDEPVLTTFANFIDAYLVEARSIGGLSGSPVWVHMPPVRVIKGQVSLYKGQQYYLLGLMQGRFNTPVGDEDVVVEGGARDDRVNSGVGVVVPARLIKEAIEQPELADERERIAIAKIKEEGAESQSAESPLPTKDENPRHAEDFRKLLDAAIGAPRKGEGT